MITEEKVIPLHEEQLNVVITPVLTDTVKVVTTTVTYNQLIDEILTSSQVEVEYIPINKEIESVPNVRTEDNTVIIPIVEEVMVKKLFLKEELRIKLNTTDMPFQETVNLRRQTAKITNIPHPKGE